MATFPPILLEPNPPALELFDLDEEYASERTRLAQLANKCTDNDIEFYILEAGKVLGFNDQSAKHVLKQIVSQLIQWKMLNPSEL